MMTLEEQLALAKTCRSFAEFADKTAYQRGREEAQNDIAEGKPNLAETYLHTEHLFGKAWTKGYTDYYHAWQVLNGKGSYNE